MKKPAIDVALEMLHSPRYTGMPVLNANHQVVGIVSEQDFLRALRDQRSLEDITVKEIMTPSPIVIDEATTLEKASKIMEDAHIPRLPVIKGDVLVGTVTRHDLLRAWLGMDVEI